MSAIFTVMNPCPLPVPAVNFGASQARGTHITIMVDGARMLSPGVLSYTLAATRLDRMAVVAVPGYHLGKKLQQRSMLEGYCEEVEAEILIRRLAQRRISAV